MFWNGKNWFLSKQKRSVSQFHRAKREKKTNDRCRPRWYDSNVCESVYFEMNLFFLQSIQSWNSFSFSINVCTHLESFPKLISYSTCTDISTERESDCKWCNAFGHENEQFYRNDIVCERKTKKKEYEKRQHARVMDDLIWYGNRIRCYVGIVISIITSYDSTRWNCLGRDTDKVENTKRTKLKRK